MDSGSADFWVPASECSLRQCGEHARLGQDVSSTFRSITDSFSVTYGTGHISGKIAKDTFTFAGLVAEGLSLGVTTVESDDFSDKAVP
jgi:cathepsin D